jgi:hypothetical protein
LDEKIVNDEVVLHAFDVSLGKSIKKYNVFSIWEEWKMWHNQFVN